MKLNDGYILHKIGGEPYVLPYGQNVADFKHGLHLNESALLLFHALEKGATEESLLALMTEHYQADGSMAPAFSQDIQLFLGQLRAMGLLADDSHQPPVAANAFFRIGTVALGYSGPPELIHPSFSDFSCEACEPDQTIRVVPMRPSRHLNGEILIRKPEIVITKTDSCYLIFYPNDPGLLETRLSLDASTAEFYCPAPFSDGLSEKLFHAVRFAFLAKAQMAGLFAVHSASILYRGKAWLFSAPSKTGKSTHAALWNRLYQAPTLNGDLNLIGFEGGSPVAYGIPWCGTSKRYTARTFPLGGIVFLKQDAQNAARPLPPTEAQLCAVQRMISPSWTKEMLLKNLDFAARLSEKIPFYSLRCNMEDSAAAAIKEQIDLCH